MVQRDRTAFANLVLIADLGLTAAAWALAYVIRYRAGWFPVPLGPPPFVWCLHDLGLIVLLAAVVYRACGLYAAHGLGRFPGELSRVVRATGLLVLLLIATAYYRHDPYESRLAVGLFLAIATTALMLLRRAIGLALTLARRRGHAVRRVLIVGSGRMARKAAAALAGDAWAGLHVIGFADDLEEADRRPGHGPAGPGTRGSPVPARPPDPSSLGTLPQVLGRIDDLPILVEQQRIDHVVIALPWARYPDVRRVIQRLEDTLADVCLVPDVPHLAAMRLTTTDFDGVPVLGLRQSPHQGLAGCVLKRAMDVAISALGLVLVSPLMAVLAALVKLTSPGPVFYSQERIGLGGQPFRMYKFRSMRPDCERLSGPVWAVARDSRCTPLGRLLRRTSLDELPQLWNVLRGDMSLVGPRPERPMFIRKFRTTVPHYMLRHSVKTGLTGWAQIHGWRGNTSLRKRVQYDLYYISHWSLRLDLQILGLTLVRGLIGKNAY